MMTEHERQARLVYSLIVAGKSANFADNATAKLLRVLAECQQLEPGKHLPFDLVRPLSQEIVTACAKAARTGNYAKIGRALVELAKAEINLKTCKPETLEAIHGIGPKTSRFFIMWIRPEEEYAALDVHVLRWLRHCGVDAPKSTPQSSKTYARLEQKFIELAHGMKLTPRQLDEQIWAQGAGRTQETALPNGV